MANRLTTKDKIINAAERLFAERGFSETSLRLITSKAEVNLASVNYHFGSKKELIQAVLARYLDQFMPALGRALEEVGEQPDLTLQAAFEAMVDPLMALNEVRHHGTALFLQLLGRGYIENQGHLRWFVSTHHGAVLSQISELVHRTTPQLQPNDIFWRMHYTLGTLVFTMSSYRALVDIAKAEFDQDNDVETVLRRLIPYMAAGVAAPQPSLSMVTE